MPTLLVCMLILFLVPAKALAPKNILQNLIGNFNSVLFCNLLFGAIVASYLQFF